ICFTDVRPGFVATDLIKDGRYPMKLRTDDVARMIVRAIEKRKAVATIDLRYRLLVFLWRMVPRRVWVRLHISS
ncbi:oxidoreductase, partial [Parabacteroides distasonis]